MQMTFIVFTGCFFSRYMSCGSNPSYLSVIDACVQGQWIMQEMSIKLRWEELLSNLQDFCFLKTLQKYFAYGAGADETSNSGVRDVTATIHEYVLKCLSNPYIAVTVFLGVKKK